jgi:hypothetical protein
MQYRFHSRNSKFTTYNAGYNTYNAACNTRNAAFNTRKANFHVREARFPSITQTNAWHHPPPCPAKVYDSLRVGGRVHAVVGRRLEENGGRFQWEINLPLPQKLG